MTKEQVDIVIRSQKSRGSNANANRFGGPDRYIAAVVRSIDSEPVGNHPLSERNALKYGWDVKYCGEGYSKNTGPNSKYGQALANANAIKERIEKKEPTSA